MPVVGLEPTYRKGQYELFGDAGRFYRPLPLHWQIILFVGGEGLEPPNPEGSRFTVCSNCHYATLPKGGNSQDFHEPAKHFYT